MMPLQLGDGRGEGADQKCFLGGVLSPLGRAMAAAGSSRVALLEMGCRTLASEALFFGADISTARF